jgi:hypothetical protein
MSDFIPHEGEEPLQQVLEDISAEIPDMGIVIDGGAACVELDLARGKGGKDLILPAQGVKKFNHSRII